MLLHLGPSGRAGERQIGLRGELHAAGWTRQHAYLLTSEQIARVQQHVAKQGILEMLSLESEDEASGYVCPQCNDLGQVLNGWRPLSQQFASSFLEPAAINWMRCSNR